MDMDKSSSLVWEYPPEEGMAITPVFLPGESHGQRSLGRAGVGGRGRGVSTIHRVAKSQTLFHSSFHGQIIDPSTKSWRKQSQKIR